MPLAAGWPQLKRKIDSLTKSPADLFKAAVEAGDVDEVRQLLQSHAELVATQDRQYQGTAVDWLVHGALGPWGFSTGQYGECARLLLGAGARVDEASLPTGHDGVDRVLREHLMRG